MAKIAYDAKRCLRVAGILKSLANAKRLCIICHLLERECTVSDLRARCGAAQSLVSQHLTRLRLEGIVASRRQGSFVYYRIADPRFKLVIGGLQRIFSE